MPKSAKHSGEIEKVILGLLEERGSGKTICPSEAARRLAEQKGSPESWRSFTVRARATAITMAKRGKVAIFQHGKRADLETLGGPIRIGVR